MIVVDGEKFSDRWTLHWANQREIASAAKVSPNVIVRLGAGKRVRLDKLQAVLEALSKKTSTTVEQLKVEINARAAGAEPSRGKVKEEKMEPNFEDLLDGVERLSLRRCEQLHAVVGNRIKKLRGIENAGKRDRARTSRNTA